MCNNFKKLKNTKSGDGKMAQWLKALTAFAED